jgi:hypothetical protein
MTTKARRAKKRPSLRDALVAARVIESAENYARARVPELPADAHQPVRGDNVFYDDREFWRQAMDRPESTWNQPVRFIDSAVFSEWVARVPGLYWRPESERLRQYTPDAVEGRDLGGVTLRPYGKSQIVIGGVGTLKLPPSAAGYRLGTLTMSANVSTGVPVLVSPEVWADRRLREGALVRAQPLLWVQMPLEWSSRFPSTKGLPLGCLVVQDVKQIDVAEGGAAQIHPYTIMEYSTGSAELFDFVFATGNTGDPQHRQRLTQFFDAYKDREGRHGRYLTAADVGDPLWDAVYTGPQELARADPAAESHLKLLERRVQARLRGDNMEELVLQALSDLPDLDFLRRISTQVGIAPATWYTGGTLADAAAQFLSRVDREQQMPEIVEALAIEHPAAMQVA